MTDITFPSFKINHGITFGGYSQRGCKGDWSVFYVSSLDYAHLYIGSRDVSGVKSDVKVPVTCNEDAENILNVIKQAHAEDWDGLRLWHKFFDKKGE